MNENLNLFDLIKIIIKWRKHLLIISLLAIIISGIVSFLLPVYYKSTAIFYAANPAINDRQNLFREQASNLPLEYFGTESDVDRVLQICKSAAISGYVINKYNLGEHYKIKNTAQYYRTKVNEEFKENSSMIRNELGAVEITIFDTDPKMAAEIANDIVATVDKINKEYFTVANEKGINIMTEQVKAKQNQIEAFTDSLVKLKSSGKTELLGNLEANKIAALKDLSSLNKLLEQYQAAANNDFTTVNSVEQAYPAEKKSKPIRWLIVAASLLMTMFISIIAIIIIEKYQSIKKQLTN